jgi:tetratricopeptide (TPR) repeat protein
MYLTKCAVCATELGLTLGKKCGRCSTRYCGPECQEQHWKEGGQDKLCKKIKRAGGAEEYNANEKYAEAVAVAAEACADDTKGQTCYICMEAVHSRTREGLVRGCACGDRDGVASGRTGIAHVSCLAEQAKILVAEAEENNLEYKVKSRRWERWHTCSLCEQEYHGVVKCALGWACWKTYLGRPEMNETRGMAMNLLGRGLFAAEHHADALSVSEAELSWLRRRGASVNDILIVQSNIANTYAYLGRHEHALQLKRDVYSGRLRLNGEKHEDTLLEANNYSTALTRLDRFEEARSLLRKIIPIARRVLGESSDLTIRMRANYAIALYRNDSATLDDLREAVTTIEDTERIARRVFGGAHPIVSNIEACLRDGRLALRRLRLRETVRGDVSALRDLMAAMPPPGGSA